MSNPDDTMLYYQRDDGESPRHFWEYEEEVDVADRFADAPLANLGFIRAALRRSVRLWATLAVLGLLAGSAVFLKFPASYEATTTIILPPPAYSGAILDYQVYAQSRTVAALAIGLMKSRQTAAELTSDYVVTPVTQRVILITVKAPSSAQAVTEANALASAFLAFQTDLLKTQAQLLNASLQEQIKQSQQQVDSLDSQISQLSAEAATSAQYSKLNSLRTQRTQAVNALNVLKQGATTGEASTQIATISAIQGSRVLDKAAPAAQHAKKRLMLYVGGGLLAGLVLGLGIVVIRALISDKLRRRDEVASALGVPVKLSVGTIRLTGRSLRRRGLAAAQHPNTQKITMYLGNAVASSSRGPANLAVVPVDDVNVAAACLVTLAVARAQQGARVVLADLCAGSPAARLMGATSPGVQRVSVDGTELTVVLPEPHDLMPSGPLGSGSDPRVAEPLSAASKTADLLLTLITLDPALGAEHLPGWTRSAVMVVTAGRSSATRIHAAGEMARLAGIPLISGVLIGADKTDESLGVTLTPQAGGGLAPREGFTF